MLLFLYLIIYLEFTIMTKSHVWRYIIDVLQVGHHGILPSFHIKAPVTKYLQLCVAYVTLFSYQTELHYHSLYLRLSLMVLMSFTNCYINILILSAHQDYHKPLKIHKNCVVREAHEMTKNFCNSSNALKLIFIAISNSQNKI